MVVIKDQPGDDVNLQTFQKSSLPRTVPVCPRTWAGQVEVESNVSRPHPVVCHGVTAARNRSLGTPGASPLPDWLRGDFGS
jgi:hypothetical protein